MKTKQILLLIIISISSINLNAQNEDLKPLRIGAKIGVPNLLTINAEYLTPLLDNRVAITTDYMALTKTIDDVSLKYKNFEIGTNIYFNNKGRGLYAGLTYFSFDAEGTFTEVEFDDTSVGDAIGDLKFNTMNIKLGAKLGKTFYYRMEVGYGFGDIPQEIVVRSTTTSQTTTEEFPEIPGVSESGLLNFNLGIGFSFF